MTQERRTYRLTGITLLLIVFELAMGAAFVGTFLTIKRFDPSISLHRAEWLPYVAFAPVLSLFFFFVLAWRNRALKRLADGDLLQTLAPRLSPTRVVLKFMFWRAATALLFIALLGPKVGSKIENIETKGIDLMIALDVSNSMMAEDLKPNRMAHSKRAIEQIIRELQGNRIGLVIFAGNAYVQLPLTTDVTSAKVFLDAVHPGIVPTQGTAIGAAIDLCVDSFDPTATAGRMILLITDGENHEDDAVSAAKTANEAGIKVCAIGAGAPGGAPLPNYNNRGNRVGFKTDSQGNTVVSALNEPLLIDIVDAGKGVFVRSSPTTVNLGPIRDAMNELEKGELGEASFTDHRHLFPLFLFAALALILLEMLIAERKWKRKMNWA